MSDHDPGFDDPAFGDPAFDDPGFDDLRARLADARASEPVPPEVAARLDATLAALREERRAETVVPLRRRAGRVLVAAAAAVVIGTGGVALAQLGQDGSGSSADKAASGGAADRSDALGVTPTAPEAAPPGTTRSGTGSDQLTQLDGAAAVPVFTTARFAAEVAHFDEPTHGFAAGDAPKATASAESPAPVSGSTDRAAPPCAGPTGTDGEMLPIVLDGAPAVLVLHPVADGQQVVEAWSCDGAHVLASATVAR